MKKEVFFLMLAMIMAVLLSTAGLSYEDDFKPVFYCSAAELAANNNRLPDKFIESLKYAPEGAAVCFASDGSASVVLPKNPYPALSSDDVTEMSTAASSGSVN